MCHILSFTTTITEKCYKKFPIKVIAGAFIYQKKAERKLSQCHNVRLRYLINYIWFNQYIIITVVKKWSTTTNDDEIERIRSG